MVTCAMAKTPFELSIEELAHAGREAAAGAVRAAWKKGVAVTGRDAETADENMEMPLRSPPDHISRDRKQAAS